MDYETAWEKSTGWIKHYWDKWKPTRFSFDDWYQECAYVFFGELKPKYDAEHCWRASKVVYERLMISLLYRKKENKIDTETIGNREWVGATCDTVFDWSIKLKPHLQQVAELIAMGYETAEIVEITGKTRDTIYTYIKNIKKIYADELGIKDYQRKHLRNFTRRRTGKELETWQKSKDRLKVVQELRKKGKYIPIRERLKQCAI